MKRLRRRNIRRLRSKKTNWFPILACIFIGAVVVTLLSAGDSEPRPPMNVSIFVNSFPYGLDTNYSRALDDAKMFWEKRGAAVFSYGQNADVTVSWIRDFNGMAVNHSDNLKSVQIALGDSNCGRWLPYTYDTVAYMTVHQFGHVIGLPDSDDRKNDMYATIPYLYEDNFEDSSSLQDGRSIYYPACEGNVTKNFHVELDSSEDLDVFIVQSRKDYENFLNDEEFNEYDCGERKVRIYSETCAVFGAGVILRNPSNMGQGPTATYKIQIKEV